MGKVIPLPPDRHRETQLLLPWYVTDRLDAADRARVEAHLASCPQCQAELKLEQRLDHEVAALPVDVERAWAAMRRRIDDEPARAVARRASSLWRWTAPALGWGVAASLAMVVTFGVLTPRPAQPAGYHTLSAAPVNPVGNVIVMFREDASERTMRQALLASHARLVDGPTAAHAYVLLVPAAGRDGALQTLRASPAVMLAQPIDSGAP